MSILRQAIGPFSAMRSSNGRALLASVVAAFAAASTATAAEPNAALSAFARDGQTFYSLSVSLPADLASDQPRDVVILVDTSASQTGAYREMAIAAVEECIAKLRPTDRVRLMAVDLQARPLSEKFFAAGSPELRASLDALRRESPLGSTDMEEALRTAISQFDAARPNGRSLLYIGDGSSKANLLGTDSFRPLVKELSAARIPVSSYAIGPDCDSRLLAALANYTGGNLYVAESLATADKSRGVTAERARQENVRIAGEIGGKMAKWSQAAVVWPEPVAWPAEMGDVYPQSLPPLRSDRDTVVVGAVKGSLPASVELHTRAASDRTPVELNWTARPNTVGDEQAYLAQIVELARRDGGATLPTVGSAGLAEAGRLLFAEIDNLAEVAETSVTMGDLAGATAAADAVLRREPDNVKALRVRTVAEQRRVAATRVAQTTPLPPEGLTVPSAGVPVAPGGGNDLTLVRPAQAAQPQGQAMMNDQAVPAEGSLFDRFTPGGAMLNAVDQQRRVFAQMLRREVENTIINARRRMSSEPDRVSQELKLTLENVERAPELAADVRSQLMDKLQRSIRETQRAAQIKDENDAELQQKLAMARERTAAEQRLTRDIEREKQLVDRVDALIDQKEYFKAFEVAELLPELDPNGVTPPVAMITSEMMHQDYKAQLVRADRWRSFVETMYYIESSSVPFPDEPPIVYPPAEIWRALSIRRKDRYGSMDLRPKGDAEERIEKALRGPLHERGLEHVGTSLEEVVNEISLEYQIPIQLDIQALDAAGLGPADPVTIHLRGITLRSALNQMLRQLKLTYIIQDEIMLITTPTEAESHLVVKVYPVADLVLPITNNLGGGLGGGGLGGGGFGGGGGGFGGGGGGFGGGGGGFGGGGGGFGGGGGGFGGGGQGGGGGFFSVPDPAEQPGQPAPAAANLKLDGKKSAATTQKAAAPQKAATTQPAITAQTATKAKGATVVRAIPITDSANPEAFWEGYFSRQIADHAAVGETIRQLMGARRFDHVIALVQAALRHNQSQPWMYETLGIAMELAGRPKSEIERAVMSAVDITSSTNELMYIAQYFSRIGIDRRAMKIYQQVAKVEPLRAEAYALALQAAQRCDDLAGIEWATVGVLSQAWPAEQAEIELKAARVAKATLERLAKEGKTAEFDAYRTRVQEVVVRDVLVHVSWTGNADVDVAVEEPSGTVCSSATPRSLGGGVSLGDSYAAGNGKSEIASETYVCPLGFPGTYRVRINRVWGDVAAGKVTVDVIRHMRSGAVQHEQHQIEVGDKDSVVAFDLDKGRRTEKLEVAQVAGALQRQQAMGNAVLAQQFGGGSGSGSGVGGASGLAATFNRAFVTGVTPVVGGGAVGFMPQLTVLPSGTMFSATGVVSADRRYVRITAQPSFSQVGNVSTFTFAGAGMAVPPPALPGAPGGPVVNPNVPPAPVGPFNLGGGGFGGR